MYKGDHTSICDVNIMEGTNQTEMVIVILNKARFYHPLTSPAAHLLFLQLYLHETGSDDKDLMDSII